MCYNLCAVGLGSQADGRQGRTERRTPTALFCCAVYIVYLHIIPYPYVLATLSRVFAAILIMAKFALYRVQPWVLWHCTERSSTVPQDKGSRTSAAFSRSIRRGRETNSGRTGGYRVWFSEGVWPFRDPWLGIAASFRHELGFSSDLILPLFLHSFK